MRSRTQFIIFWILIVGFILPACAQRPLAIYVLDVNTNIKGDLAAELAENLTTSIQTAFSKYPADFKMLERSKLNEIAKQSKMEQNLKSFARGEPSSPQLSKQLFSEANAVLRGKLINTSDGAYLTLSLTQFNSEIMWNDNSDRYRLSEWLSGKQQAEVAAGLAKSAAKKIAELAMSATAKINNSEKSPLHISSDDAVQGIDLAKQGHCPEAMPYLTNAAEVDSKNTEVLFQMGRCQNQAGDYQSAATSLMSAIETNKTRSDLFVERAMSYSALKDFPAAQRDLDQALKRDPGNLAAIELRGDISMTRGRYPDAVDAYYEVYQQQPTSSRCKKLAAAYLKNGVPDASIKQERACGLAP